MSYNRIEQFLRFVHYSSLSFLLLFFFLIPFITNAQTTNQRQSTIGTPYITNFHFEDLVGFASIWAITQDHRGVMYFATDIGVYEFDGSEWNLIEISNAGAARSLAFDAENNRVYVGLVDELGYLEPASIGQMQYKSLKHKIPEKYRKFSDVWQIHVTKHGLFLFDSEHITHFKTETDDFFKLSSLYLPGTRLSDGKFVLATFDAGLVVLNKNGDLIYRIDKTNGLTDNSVTYTYQDNQGGLWVGGYSSGLSRIEIASQLTVIDEKRGLKFPIYDIVRFEKSLYVATNFDKKTDILTPAGMNAIRNKQIADEIERTIVYV